MDRAVIDHRGPEFAALTKAILPPLRAVFGTQDGAVILYPTSGTGAWEASLVNVLAPGDRVLAFNYGHFSALFAQTARNLGFEVDEVPLRWGQDSRPTRSRRACGSTAATAPTRRCWSSTTRPPPV